MTKERCERGGAILPRLLLWGLAGGLSLGTAGCSKGGVGGELAAWKDAGHSVSAFADSPAATMGAKQCQTGTIDQVPVLVCEYASPEAAAQGEAAADGWVGNDVTGAVLRRGHMLLAVADRVQKDPQGKIISAITKVFRRVKRK
jgi:hypothetical protein